MVSRLDNKKVYGALGAIRIVLVVENDHYGRSPNATLIWVVVCNHLDLDFDLYGMVWVKLIEDVVLGFNLPPVTRGVRQESNEA